MGTYAVNTSQLRICAEELGGLQRELDSVALRLTGFQVGSFLQFRGSATLLTRIGNCKWAAISRSEDIGLMSQGLADVAELYETVEKALTDPQTKAQAQARAEAAEAESNFWLDLLDQYPILDCLGFTVETIGRIVWDLGDIFANGVSIVACGLESIIDNFQEFSDDLLTPEFFFELVGEAGVDVGIGLVIGEVLGSLVGGTAAFAATLAVPEIAVVVGIAAVTTGICLGIDALCEWATGDDFSELVVDTYENIAGWVSDGLAEVVDTAEALWNSAGEFLDTLLPW